VHSDVLYLVDSDEDVKPSVMPRIAEWQDRCWAGQRCGGRQQEGSCDVREVSQRVGVINIGNEDLEKR
jgi:hypothetical protein